MIVYKLENVTWSWAVRVFSRTSPLHLDLVDEPLRESCRRRASVARGISASPLKYVFVGWTAVGRTRPPVIHVKEVICCPSKQERRSR